MSPLPACAAPAATGVYKPRRPQASPGPVPLPLREARRRWAELLRQIFEVDPLRCPQCGAEMRIVAFIITRAVIDRILDHVRRPRDTARGPPRRAPRRPARQPKRRLKPA